mmetsp:Transcript_8564/g.19067  ORF Transcript_8564/g.19067 Transcript_8564/m.19067 type:complete len:413 (-) Transcript_8564:27-1265(-)|eukprot:CAMPEP_0178434108 /NCGR_PEP_ID=MMETSP0689_2-20121128/33254_1 /TAXON_ID=160604 /ORGANISM="Amphidinium massartii, Strain CS-259" /LENGTH=412 /DNA_ID=CAMNT_0020056163 /DNA_START=1 /DNA_END=1239 /DNA_ORIENTATION=-
MGNSFSAGCGGYRHAQMSRLKQHDLKILFTLYPEKEWRAGHMTQTDREFVWPLAIGNELRITRNLYEIHLQQARKQNDAAGLAGTGGSSGSCAGQHQAVLDLNRTFPALGRFAEGQSKHLECLELIQAYEFYRPDIKYVQGMSYLIAMLSLHMKPYETFVGFCNLLNTPSILGLYSLDRKAVDARADVFWRLCREVVPAVERRLEEVSMKGIFIDMFLMEWFMTLFAKTLPYEIAAVIWDLFLLDGEVVLYSASVAVLQLAAEHITSEACRSEDACLTALRSSLTSWKENPARHAAFLQQLQEVLLQPSLQLLEDIRRVESTEFGPSTEGLHAIKHYSVGGMGLPAQPQQEAPGPLSVEEAIRRKHARAGDEPADMFLASSLMDGSIFPEPYAAQEGGIQNSGKGVNEWTAY